MLDGFWERFDPFTYIVFAILTIAIVKGLIELFGR